MAWRKTFLDGNIESLHVNGVHKKVAGALTGGLIGEDVFGLDITGSQAAAEAARAGVAGSERIAERDIEFRKWLWGEQKELTQPFVEAGKRGLKGYEQAIAKPFTAADMEMDPGYQFRLSEDMKGIETSASARGMQLSGRTLKGIGRYAQDYASGEFQAAYGRRQQGISNLYNLATMGQAAATGQAVQGGVMGQGISQAYGRLGEAQMEYGQIGAAQAQAPWNALMGIGGLGAMFYGAGGGAGGGNPFAVPSGGMDLNAWVAR